MNQLQQSAKIRRNLGQFAQQPAFREATGNANSATEAKATVIPTVK